MEAAALFERVSRVSLPRLEFRFSSRPKAGYGLHAIALGQVRVGLYITAKKIQEI